MILRSAAIFALAQLPLALYCQAGPGTVPAGAPLALSIDRNYPMRMGETIHARLMYGIYADNKLMLPANTEVTGSVVALEPDRVRRLRARLGGDFTPFRTPEVRFTQVVLTDGRTVALESGAATNGTQVYRAVTPPPSKGGFLRQEFNNGVNAARGDLANFIAPGKGDRLLQWVYSQIPYHPQRIDKGTTWTVETTAAMDVPAQAPAPIVAPAPPKKQHFWEVQTPKAAPPENKGAWIVQADLDGALSSETSKAGQLIKAVVAEPIYTADNNLAVPQGAVLTGEVTRARPARRWGRTGVLTFNFSQLQMPDQETQNVETRLTGADSTENLALNSEGQATSKPQDKLAIPFILAVMASRPLDQDNRSGHPTDTTQKEGVGGAAGLGLVGTAIGIAGGSRYFAASIGYWGAARSIFRRWIAPGQKINFAKDTRIVVETTPRRSAPMRPEASSPH